MGKELSRLKVANVKKFCQTKVAPKVPIKNDLGPHPHEDKGRQSLISSYNSSPGQTHFLKEVKK